MALDPTTAYEQPPQPRQQQDMPGLTGEMDPRPDHGEESYKGSGRLSGRAAIITGGDSGSAALLPSPSPARVPTS